MGIEPILAVPIFPSFLLGSCVVTTSLVSDLAQGYSMLAKAPFFVAVSPFFVAWIIHLESNVNSTNADVVCFAVAPFFVALYQAWNGRSGMGGSQPSKKCVRDFAIRFGTAL